MEDPTPLQIALEAADAGNAGHWPTVAGILAEAYRDLESKIENASQACSETQQSHKHRCYAIMGALWLDVGDPEWLMPDESNALKTRIAELEGIIQTQQTSGGPVPQLIPNVQVFRNGRWQRTDGTPLTYEELMTVAVNLEKDVTKQSEWKYGHCEIESACGGRRALWVREKVLKRREAFRKSSGCP